MTRVTSKRPAFVGIDWASSLQGYEFLRPQDSVEILGIISKETGNDWGILLGIFEKARTGNFNDIYLLPDLIQKSTDPHVQFSGIKLLGDAGSGESVQSIANLFFHSDTDLRFAAYSAAVSSANIHLIREMIKSADRVISNMELNILADAVSESLEYSYSRFIEPSNISEFQDRALKKTIELGSENGEDKPVLFGNLLNIRIILNKIQELLSSSEDDLDDLIIDNLLRFEAMTGLYVNRWIDEEGIANRSELQQFLTEFEDDGKADEYKIGVRYFFGNEIPSIT